MTTRLTRLSLKGFKSIASAELDLRPLNILIGPNGAGKSNLIAFFRMLSAMMAPPTGGLQQYVAENGGANVLLHDGAKRTERIEAELGFEAAGWQGLRYRFGLTYAAGDSLFFGNEACAGAFGDANDGTLHPLGSGQLEARLMGDGDDGATSLKPPYPNLVTSMIRSTVRASTVYHFHDTTRTARIKQRWPTHDNHALKHDAANLAPFLLRLREQEPGHYRRMVDTIRLIAPFFDDFVLEPDYGSVMLQWRERGSDVVFAVHQASDGMLRAMALVAALLQPAETRPALMIFDEPELGLHPYAMTVVAGLMKAAAEDGQVIVATQSAQFLDQFSAEDVIVTERHGRESVFRRLDEAALAEWLEEYSLGELWLRNILGGRPRSDAGP